MALKAYLNTRSDTDLEQRHAPRLALQLVTSGTLPGGLEANVTVHNISAGGLLIETDVPLSMGDAFAIDLPQAGQVDARIVWVSDQLFGCAFDQAIGEDALAATQLMAGAPSLAPSAPSGFRRPTRETVEPLGIKLNRLRRDRGMTLADIAGKLGVSKPTVWAWEKSKARPVPSRLPDIAAALGISVQELGEAAPAGEASAVTEECRVRIATVHGTGPESVRIMIEV